MPWKNTLAYSAEKSDDYKSFWHWLQAELAGLKYLKVSESAEVGANFIKTFFLLEEYAIATIYFLVP